MLRSLALTIAVTLLAATSASAASVTISGGGNVPEGGSASFQISESWASTCTPTPCHAAELEPTVNLALSDGTAVTPDDYGALTQSSSGEACGAGACTRTLFGDVPVRDDNIDEPNETFTAGYGYSFSGGGGSGAAQFTIIDNDPPPAIEIDGGKVTEGNGGTASAKFELELSHPSAFPIDVSYHTEDGTGHAGSDYQSRSGTVHFDPLETEKDVHVEVNGDTTDEADETFRLRLSNPVNATLNGDEEGKATILDDDLAPTVAIGNDSLREGDSGSTQATFDVLLSAASGLPVTVAYGTGDSTARGGSDYRGAQGTLTFAPGETHKQVTVAVNGDTTFEPDETFAVRLATPVNVTLGDAAGEGKVLNDDPEPVSDSGRGNNPQSSATSGGSAHGQSGSGSSGAGQAGKRAKRQRGPRMHLSIVDSLVGQRLHLAIACPAAEELCRGTVTLSRTVSRRRHGKRRVLRLGSVSFRIAGGDSREVSVELSSAARRFLAGGGKAVATVVARDEDGNVGVTRRGFHL